MILRRKKELEKPVAITSSYSKENKTTEEVSKEEVDIKEKEIWREIITPEECRKLRKESFEKEEEKMIRNFDWHIRNSATMGNSSAIISLDIKGNLISYDRVSTYITISDKQLSNIISILQKRGFRVDISNIEGKQKEVRELSMLKAGGLRKDSHIDLTISW